jgi:solute carrier family 25 protein 38
MLPDAERLTPLETGFESYPPEYVAHNVPFVVLSGLREGEESDIAQVPERYGEGALRIHCDFPPVKKQRAESLVWAFRSFERKDDQWDTKPVVEGSNVMGLKFKVVGRV